MASCSEPSNHRCLFKEKKNDQQKNWQVTLQALRASGFHYLLLIFYLTRKWGRGKHKEMRVFYTGGGMKIIEHLSVSWKKCSYQAGQKAGSWVDYRAGDAYASLNLCARRMLRQKEPDTGTKCRQKQVHCGI